MSSVKIRFVKCPSCWNVLPESVDVPVYKCGGCGKILQAKYRQQQQEQEQQGGEDNASGSSRSEEGVGNSTQGLQPSDDELNIPHGVTEEEANSNVEEESNNDQTGIFESSSNVDEEEESQAPPNFQRIMSGSTDYVDPCSTFSGMLSETCNSPSTQSIHQYGYAASLSSLDTSRDERRRRTNGNGSTYRSSFFNLPPRPRLLPLYQSNGSRGSPSENFPKKNYRHSMSYNNNKPPPVSPDEEKMKLLKIVYELEEQLKKTCSFQGEIKHPATRTSPQRRQHWNGDDYLRCSRIPFSAEVGLGDHRYPLPRDRQHSAPLPPPPNKKGIHRSSIINSYRSWPSSPVPQLLSPWEEEDPTYGFLKLQTSNLHKKKHLRPIARAAPFIACKKCSDFLELPGDFLLSKGRCHRVRCGGCSIVMRFSLENRTYLVPFHEEEDDDLDFRAPAPPPSEAEESSMNMTSSSISRGKIRYSQVPGRTGSHHVGQVCRGFGSSFDNGATSSMQKQ